MILTLTAEMIYPWDRDPPEQDQIKSQWLKGLFELKEGTRCKTAFGYRLDKVT